MKVEETPPRAGCLGCVVEVEGALRLQLLDDEVVESGVIGGTKGMTLGAFMFSAIEQLSDGDPSCCPCCTRYQSGWNVFMPAIRP